MKKLLIIYFVCPSDLFWADQMTFINTIISYLSKNGTIDVSMLYSSPFIDINHEGIDGVFDLEKKKEVVRIIDQINYNAIA